MISGGKAPDPKFEQVRFSEADAKFMRTAITGAFMLDVTVIPAVEVVNHPMLCEPHSQPGVWLTIRHTLS